MTQALLWTTEPLATRALAAEIRHEPSRFLDALARRMDRDSLGRLIDVRCEKGKEKIDIALSLADPPLEVAIEAKFDHELTVDEVERELGEADHLIVLLLEHEHAPLWLSEKERTSVMTWQEALACFDAPRLTLEDVRAARSAKSAVEVRLKTLVPSLTARLGQGWQVLVERGGAGMPAINFYSKILPDMSQLRGVLQVAGYGMPHHGAPIRLRFSVGTSVTLDDGYPEDLSAPPAWVVALRRLRDDVIGSRRDSLLLSRRRPSSGHANDRTPRGRAHTRKLAIVDEHFDARDRWLTGGYIDWIVGPASVQKPLEDVEQLAEALVTILEGWYRAEVDAAANSEPSLPVSR